MKLLLPLLFLVFSLFPLITPSTTTPPPLGILNAAETLSNSGYNAMSLTLQLILSSIEFPKGGKDDVTPLTHTTLTIFTPPDSSFETKGQPSLSHLLLHFSPLSLSSTSLSSLPFGTKIPTLSTEKTPLVVTSLSPYHLSINNVNIKNETIFDDGSLIVFAIDDFFDAEFTLQDTNIPSPGPMKCTDVSGVSSFSDAATKMKGRGYSIMASFLELQLMGYLKLGDSVLQLTMFAPEDEVLLRFVGDIGTYSGLLMKHLLPCKLSYADLNGVMNGTVFKGGFDGMGTMIERTDKDLFVNGVEITFPDLYFSDWLVIHGISDVITQQPDDTVVGQEEMEEEEGDKHDNAVSGVSYEEEASSPNGNEL